MSTIIKMVQEWTRKSYSKNTILVTKTCSFKLLFYDMNFVKLEIKLLLLF